jgi:cephalosporin-C deacetylase
MPLIDMPIEKLLTYEGRNPRPDDFDDYWARALAEMKAVDPALEMMPADFQVPGAECFELYFTGVGGARIHAKYARPAGAAIPHPAVLMFHGYSGSSGDWHDKLSWVGMGFAIAAIDCRGQAGQSEDVGGVQGNTLRGHIIRGLAEEPDKLMFRSHYLDTAQLAGLVMGLPEVDSQRVGAFGGSQGGGLTLACAALEPRIAKAAPLNPFLCDFQRVWEMDLGMSTRAELEGYFRMFDPRHERAAETFTRLGYIDCQHLAPRIKAEVLLGTGLMDTACPPSTQFAVYNKLTAPKNYVLYPDFAHEYLPGFLDQTMQFMSGK